MSAPFCVTGSFWTSRSGAAAWGTFIQPLTAGAWRQLTTSPYVAIKLLNESYRNDTDAVRLLEAEARKSQALAHPNITTVYDFDRDKADVFIVMEQLNGVGLDRRIGRALGKPLPLGECARILRGTCAGLSHAHSRGVVHSDLKPGNIFLLTDGTIKLLISAWRQRQAPVRTIRSGIA